MQSHAVIFFQKNNLTNTESYAIVIDFTENIKYKTVSNSVRIKFRIFIENLISAWDSDRIKIIRIKK